MKSAISSPFWLYLKYMYESRFWSQLRQRQKVTSLKFISVWNVNAEVTNNWSDMISDTNSPIRGLHFVANIHNDCPVFSGVHFTRSLFWKPEKQNEQEHEKTNKMMYVFSEDSDQPRHFCPVWSETSLSAWRELWSLVTHKAYSKDSEGLTKVL